MNLTYLIFISLFSVCIGSFLNVLIYRLPLKLTVLEPLRSICTSCKTELGSLENIPILSWVYQKGRCKHCSEKISGRYPFVEALSVVFAIATYLRFGFNPTAVAIYIFSVTLIVIAYIDLDHKIIPDVITKPGMAVGVVMGTIAGFYPIFTFPISTSLYHSALGLIIGGGIFKLIDFIYLKISKRHGIGGGDVKYLAMVGAWFGPESLITTIFAGSFLGAIFGIIEMKVKKSGRHTEIPFGPWLTIGTAVYLFTDFELFPMSAF